MTLMGFKDFDTSTVYQPPPWWQLPFSTAVCLHGYVIRRCQLCHVGIVKTSDNQALIKGAYSHWFNRLAFICQDCHNNTVWRNADFDIDLSIDSNPKMSIIQGMTSVAYQFPYDAIMRRYKNSQQLEALLPLIHAIRQLPVPADCHAKNSLIIPVPTTPQRLKDRGFAPLWWLALYLSFHWQIPIFTGIQRHERQHQQGLNREQRLDNLKDAFYFTERPTAKNLILFDDVVTTGATMQAIVTALSQFCAVSKMSARYNLDACCLLHG